MKLFLIFSAVGVMISGPFGSNQPVDTQQASNTSIPLATPQSPGDKMWCDKNVIGRGETITLHFRRPHGRFLGVIDADGHFFYLVFPALDAVEKLQPLITSELFVDLDSLTLDPHTLKADPYTYGVMENQPVFTKSGIYRIILGNNLHTDDATSVTTLLIQYQHNPSDLTNAQR